MTDNAIVVPFTFEDIPSLVKIEEASFSSPFKEKDFIDILDSSISNVLTVKVEGVVVAFVSFTFIIDECQIINVAVAPQYRRQGYGQLVLKELISHCRKMGGKKFFLEARESNISAISLYRKLGFVEVGISKNHFSLPRENAILMNLEIEE